MTEMKNLCRALIWSACFLELSGEDTVDPDSAMKALEEMAATLQSATVGEKQAFSSTCTEEANRLTIDAGSEYAKAAEFIRGLPKAFGISE